MTDIYFIRHGQASFGTRDYDRLSELGKQQAQILADYLIDMEAYFPVIFSGSKQRQIDTAKIVMNRFKDNDVGTYLKIFPELDEFDVFNLLKNCKNDIIQDDPSISVDLERALVDYQSFQKLFVKIVQWSLSKNSDGFKSENFQTFKNRVKSGIQTIINESHAYKKVAVVTSGGVLSIAMQMACGLPDTKVIDLLWYFYNTSITVFYVDGNRLELKLDNSVVHLKNLDNHELLTYV